MYCSGAAVCRTVRLSSLAIETRRWGIVSCARAIQIQGLSTLSLAVDVAIHMSTDSTTAAPYPREQAREIIEFQLSHNVHWARRLVGKHSVDRGGSLSRAAVSRRLTMRMSDCGSLKGCLGTGAVPSPLREEIVYTLANMHELGVREQRSGCSAAVERVERRSEDHEGLMKQSTEGPRKLVYGENVLGMKGDHSHFLVLMTWVDNPTDRQSVHGAYKRGRVVTTLALIRIRQRSKSRRPFKGGLCIGLADVGVTVLKRLRAVSGQEGHHIDVLDHMRWSDSSIFMRPCTCVSTADNEQRVDCSWAEENDVWDVLDHVRWSEGSRSCRTTALELRVRFDSRLGLLGGMRRTVWKRSEEQLHKRKHGGSKQLWAVSKEVVEGAVYTLVPPLSELEGGRRTEDHEKVVGETDIKWELCPGGIVDCSNGLMRRPFLGEGGHRLRSPGPCEMVRRFSGSVITSSSDATEALEMMESRRSGSRDHKEVVIDLARGLILAAAEPIDAWQTVQDRIVETRAHMSTGRNTWLDGHVLNSRKSLGTVECTEPRKGGCRISVFFNRKL
ncbi:hypothetical protein JOM56_012855 [Amanita muscaria]